jgi:glycosyltransferase involved in cell wall biosynthesis
MPVRLIYNHIAHHAAHSGYDQLAKYVCARPYRDGLLYKLTGRVRHARLEGIPAYHTPWYSGWALRREIAICARTALLPARTLFHWFYAENDVRVCARWRWRWNNRFVASFHQPPEFLDGHVADKSYIRGLDGIVVMARSQIPYMSQFVPEERIYCVPHGVAVDHWKPDPDVPRRPEPTFLFVGVWLRDIEMAKATIRKCAAAGLPARFRIVTFPDRVEEFAVLPNTTVLTRIPDAQLLEEYRSAHALFLPLALSTANNAMLEAMSCGTSVISTRVGGVAEYVSDGCGALVPGKDVDAAVAAIRQACASRTWVEQSGMAARQRALDFSWEKMGALQDSVYRSILRGRRDGARPA